MLTEPTQHDDLEREAGTLESPLAWLYPDPKRPCLCDHGIGPGCRLFYGVNMGPTWGRTTTHPKCYHHGTEAQKFYEDNLRRFRKTGDWAEFLVDRDEWERAHIDGGGGDDVG